MELTTIKNSIHEIKKTKFCALDDKAIQLKIDKLINAKDLPIERMIEVFQSTKKEFENNRLVIGSKYGGGIVFFLDKSRNHGLVCSEVDFGKSIWGSNMKIGSVGNGICDGSGIANTKLMLEFPVYQTEIIKDGWFSKKEIKKKK